MKKVVGGRWSVTGRRRFLTLCLLLAACGSLNCGSVPNLEPAQCTEARGVVKEFYSYHFGSEMRFSPENLQKREKYLTPEYIKSLQSVQTDGDVFTTNNTDFPKAFRVGGCRVVDPSKADLEVLLFWKTDTRSEQREIRVEAVKQGDKWMINRIFN